MPVRLISWGNHEADIIVWNDMDTLLKPCFAIFCQRPPCNMFDDFSPPAKLLHRRWLLAFFVKSYPYLSFLVLSCPFLSFLVLPCPFFSFLLLAFSLPAFHRNGQRRTSNRTSPLNWAAPDLMRELEWSGQRHTPTGTS